MRLFTIPLLSLVTCFVLATGCKTSHKLSIDESVIESSKKSILDSMLRIQKIKDSLYFKEVSALKSSGVVFRDKPVPIYVSDLVGRDSLLDIISQLNGKIISMQTEVSIGADGSIKAKGPIESAFIKTDLKDREIKRLKESFDSLSRLKKADTIHNKKTEMSLDESKKSKPPSFPWLILAIGFAAGLFCRPYLNKFISILKSSKNELRKKRG